MSQTDGRMEGWLYTIRHYRFGLQFSRKRYFLLLDNNLKSFRSVPSDQNEVYLLFFALPHFVYVLCSTTSFSILRDLRVDSRYWHEQVMWNKRMKMGYLHVLFFLYRSLTEEHLLTVVLGSLTMEERVFIERYQVLDTDSN